MTTKINLGLVPKDTAKAVEREDIIIVIDVLRCSSTIVTALANEALDVTPVETLREALKLRGSHLGYVLAGERRGLKPKGFDLGNSPLEFTSEKVAGKHVVLTTTSGTKALIRSREAGSVLIGALVNARAVAEESLEMAEKEGVGISLILAGKKGRFSLEDFVGAGAIIKYLGNEVRPSDAASAASLSFQRAHSDLCGTLLKGEHAQHLVGLGLEDDVEFCSRLNCYSSVVPIYRNGVVALLSQTRSS